MLDGSGVEITSREGLEDFIRRAARAGFSIAVHAIGDRANRDALDAFEATRSEWQPLGLRQHGAGVLQQRPTGLGRGDALSRPHQERRAQRQFHVADARAGRG